MIKSPKNKGNKFELKVYYDLKQLGNCKRTVGSGSSIEVADITFNVLGTKTIYHVECKHYKSLSHTQLQNFWSKLLEEIEEKDPLSALKTAVQAIPTLIYKENYEPVKVMTMMGLWRVTMLYEDWKIYVQGGEE